MKSRVGLAISVGLNFGLVGVMSWLWLNPPGAPPPNPGEVEIVGPDAGEGTNQVQIRYLRRPEFRFPTNGLPRFSWRIIESPDYRKYVANLRAIDCPEKTIRDIIVADVNDLYATKWKELLKKSAADFHYWQTGNALPGYPDETTQHKAKELDAERKSLLKELLGIDVTDSVTQFGAIDPMELTLGFLPEDRRRKVIALQNEYAQAQSSLLAAGGDAGELEAALAQLRDEHQAKLSALMSPEEMSRYEMTMSPLAMALRSELSGFEPTEEEFRQIYEARKAQAAEVEATRVFLGAQIQAQEAQEAADQQAHAAAAAANAALLDQLGPGRYAQLQSSGDPNYQLLMRVSATSEVPAVAAQRAYEYQQIAEVEAEKVRANANLTLEQREVALNSIRAETERTIQEKLGDAALRAYRQWNQQIVRQQNAAAAASQ